MTDRVPNGGNPEGAPTLVYEVWDWCYARHGREWRFIGYQALSLRQVLRYQDFGYHVERSPRGTRDVAWSTDDRGYTPPLFPRLGSAEDDPGHGMDQVPVSKPGTSGGPAFSIDLS